MRSAVLPALCVTALLSGAATATLLSGAATATAAPAAMSGDYQVRADGSEFGVWTFTSDCEVSGDGCTAQVQPRNRAWTAVATLSEGRWSLTRTSETLFGCGDGTATPGELRANWDGATLSGSLLLVPSGARCGGSSAPLRSALKLIKV